MLFHEGKVNMHEIKAWFEVLSYASSVFRLTNARLNCSILHIMVCSW